MKIIVIVMHDKHADDLYACKDKASMEKVFAKVLRTRIDDGWYDYDTDEKERAETALHVNRAYGFICSRQDNEYEGFTIETPEWIE